MQMESWVAWVACSSTTIRGLQGNIPIGGLVWVGFTVGFSIDVLRGVQWRTLGSSLFNWININSCSTKILQLIHLNPTLYSTPCTSHCFGGWLDAKLSDADLPCYNCGATLCICFPGEGAQQRLPWERWGGEEQNWVSSLFLPDQLVFPPMLILNIY